MTAKRKTTPMKAKRTEATAMQAEPKRLRRDPSLKPTRQALATHRGLNVEAMEDEQVLALWRRLPKRVRQQYQGEPAGDDQGTGGRGTGESPTPDA